MATKSQAYDHPAYIVVGASAHTTTAGNGTIGARFTAFTNLLIKSVTATVVTAGTSATTGHGLTFRTITATGTTTTSVGAVALNTLTAGVSTNVAFTAPGLALAQGETIAATNGTDTTGVAGVVWEYVLNPGANITA